MLWGKWLNRTLVWPFLLLFLLLIVLLFTQPGLRLSVWLADHVVDELTIGHSEGAWLTGITLTDIHFQNASIDAQLDQLSFRLQKRCLIQLRLCIPELALRGSRITVASTTQSIDTAEETAVEGAKEEKGETASVTSLSPLATPALLFPIPLRIEKLILENAAITLPEQQITWQHLSLGIVAWGNRLQLSAGRWQDVHVTLAPANTAETPDFTEYRALVLPQLRLPLSVYLDDFQLNDLHFTQGELTETLPALTLSAQLSPTQIRLLDATARHQLGTAQLAANIALTPNVPLTAELNLALSQAESLGELAGQQAQLHVAGDLSKLQLTLNTVGPINANLAAELALLTDDLPLSLTLQSEQLQWPLTQPTYQLAATRVTVAGTLSELAIELNSQFTGDALPDTQIQLSSRWQHWQQRAELTSLRLATLGGDIEASGHLVLQPTLSWQLALALNAIQPGITWPEYPGTLTGKIETTGSQDANGLITLAIPQLQFAGKLRELPFNLAGSLNVQGQPEQANWQVVTPGLTLSHGKNNLTLSGQLAEEWQLDGSVNLPELAASYPALRGAVQGKVTLRGPALTPDINLNLEVARLAYADMRLRQATLAANIALASPIKSEIRLTAQQGRWQQQRLQNLELALTGTELAHQLDINVTADALSATLSLEGALQNRQQWQGALNTVLLQTPVGEWQLQAPIPLTADLPTQQLSVGQHCWQQAPATLCLTESTTLSAATGAIKMALREYPLAQLNSVLPLNTTVQGDLALQLTAAWQANMAPTITLDVNSEQGSITQQFDVPVNLAWSALRLNNTMAQHQLRSKLTVNISDSGTLTAQALVSDLNAVDKPLRAEITLDDLTLTFLRPLLDEYSELAGTLSSQLSLNGTLANPTVQGELKLAALKVRGKLAPTDIEQADLIVNFIGAQALLAGQVKTPEGFITLSGNANWQELEHWRAALQIQGDELKLQIPQAELYVKPDLQIAAQPGRSRITGTVSIPRATITIDSLPQNAVGISSDHILLNRRLEAITVEQANNFAVETDIRVQLGNRVNLSAFGLKTRLNGELRVQQQQINPTVRGEVSLRDGTFRAYGQDLLIRQGKMTFSGPADQPFLNVEAIRNPANMEDDVIAGIRVTGPADEPVISIFSEPSKPQANALSYLIMGRNLDSESGSTANSVTTSLIGMSIASSGKLVGEIGEAFGVSDLTLDTEGAGDNSQVTVSGYLTRDLQLKYGIGIFQPIGQFTLRYRLMRSLFLEAVSGMDNAVDLLYKFEFD